MGAGNLKGWAPPCTASASLSRAVPHHWQEVEAIMMCTRRAGGLKEVPSSRSTHRPPLRPLVAPVAWRWTVRGTVTTGSQRVDAPRA
jgi:hypothetical protein